MPDGKYDQKGKEITFRYLPPHGMDADFWLGRVSKREEADYAHERISIANAAKAIQDQNKNSINKGTVYNSESQ